jgi:hypothetical protein
MQVVWEDDNGINCKGMIGHDIAKSFPQQCYVIRFTKDSTPLMGNNGKKVRSSVDFGTTI